MVEVHGHRKKQAINARYTVMCTLRRDVSYFWLFLTVFCAKLVGATSSEVFLVNWIQIQLPQRPSWLCFRVSSRITTLEQAVVLMSVHVHFSYAARIRLVRGDAGFAEISVLFPAPTNVSTAGQLVSWSLTSLETAITSATACWTQATVCFDACLFICLFYWRDKRLEFLMNS